MTDPPRVCGLFGDMNGCTLWRLFWPYTALRKLGVFAIPCMKDGVGEYDPLPMFMQANTVVVARLTWAELDDATRWRDMCHRHGKAVVYEADDDLFTRETDERMLLFNPEYTAEDMERERQRRIHALRLCDGVTVTTPRLATIVRAFTDAPVEVVPNLIDWHWFQREVRQGERVTPSPCIGWAGGKRPDRDVAPMAQAWSRIARRFPEAHFAIQGWQPDVLRDAVPPERLTLLPWARLEEYPRGFKNFDIACCPLEDSQFNRCKTGIKAFEYTAAGACVVGSETVYGGLGAEGRGLLVAETADEWEDALATLIAQPELRTQMQRSLTWRIRKLHSLDSPWHGQPAVTRWVGAWQRIREAYAAKQPRRLLWVPS